MTIKAIEAWSMYLGIGGLILFMGFIVWDLAKKSNAGKFGTVVLFTALGLGLLGFLIKVVMMEVLAQ